MARGVHPRIKRRRQIIVDRLKPLMRFILTLPTV